MNILLVVGIALLISWLGVEISSWLLTFLENAIVATGSIIVASLVLYILIATGLI